MAFHKSYDVDFPDLAEVSLIQDVAQKWWMLEGSLLGNENEGRSYSLTVGTCAIYAVAYQRQSLGRVLFVTQEKNFIRTSQSEVESPPLERQWKTIPI